MISYQIYAFRMAMNEVLHPGAQYVRDLLFEKEIPDITKAEICKNTDQAKEVFAAAIDGFKKNLEVLEVDSVWETINPVVPLTEKIVELDDEIQEINNQLILEESPIEEKLLMMRRNSLLNRIAENTDAATLQMNHPAYEETMDTMAAYKNHIARRLPKATASDSKSETPKKVPMQWVFNEHFTPHMN